MNTRIILSGLFSILFGALINAQEIPSFSSDEEKQKWIDENESQYLELQKTTNSIATFSTEASDSSNYRKLEAANFPTLINTGNPELDAQNYQKAKLNWIAQNERAYRDIIQNEDRVIILSKEEFDMVSEEKKELIRNSSNYMIIDSSTNRVSFDKNEVNNPSSATSVD